MLENINSPEKLKEIPESELDALAAEIRAKIVSSAADTGGHLASNLGMVEATVALHRVFDPPADSIIFDVGHQCYAHKLLTGRYSRFDTIRRLGGISGFTNREESEYDVLTAGHSGSALPCALGIARANAIDKKDGWAVAVIGDGSFTNGMVYETLNSCIDEGLKLIILLNDNEMSISKNVGGVPRYFTRLRNSKRYFSFKKHLQAFFGAIPLIGHGIVMGCYHIKEFLKRLLLQKNFFESMGLYYLGPVDGNDEKKMELLLREAKTKDKCTLIHMITVKGKGYEPAEKNPDRFHFAGGFDPQTGEMPGEDKSFSLVFGEHICKAAKSNGKIVAVTAAMDKGTGLSRFKKEFPERFFDVGIAEECAATFTCGLAIGNKIPVLALYSTFMQRAYDQILEDLALQKVHAVLAIDRAGLVEGDGATHQGVYDVSLLAGVPHMTLYSPETYAELCRCLDRCIDGEGLCAVRYPKGKEREYDRSGFRDVGNDIGVLGDGECDGVIVTYGRLTENAVAARNLLAGTYNIKVVKLTRLLPFDKNAVLEACRARAVLMLEEGSRSGGIGEMLGSAIAENGVKTSFAICAVEDFLTHAGVDELIRHCAFDAESVAHKMTDLLKD